MANPYYNYSGAFIPGTLARAETETAEFQSVQQGFNLLSNSGLDTGVVNALVVTTPYAPTALTDGATVVVKVKLANTAAATLAANGLPATNILRGNGAALQIGDLTANVWTTFTYDSSFAAWLLSAPAAFTATSGVTVIASGPPVNKVGLVAAAGVSLQVVPIDATYAIDQSIAPTWTGDHTFTPSAGRAIAVNAAANQYGVYITGSATSGQSYGLGIQAGTTSVDAAFSVSNKANTLTFLTIFGDGHGTLGPSSSLGLSWTVGGNIAIAAPTSGTTFSVTGFANQYVAFFISANTAGQDFGVQIQAGSTSADSALNVINRAGTATFLNLKGDGSGTIGPSSALGLSWSSSGNVSIATPSAGQALAVTGAANSQTVSMIASSTVGQSFGLLIEAGTNSLDTAIDITNQAANVVFFEIFGDGHGFVRPTTSTGLSWTATGNYTIAAPTSGVSFTANGTTGINLQQWISTGAAAALSVGFNVGLLAGGTWNVDTQSTDALAIGTSGAASLLLYTGGSQRIAINSSGNVTVNAPSSGIPVTISSTNGTNLRIQDTGANNSIIDIKTSNAGPGIIDNTWGTSAVPFSLRMGGTEVLGISTARNVTIPAPSSGATVALTFINNVGGLTMSDGTGSGEFFFAIGHSLNLGTITNNALNFFVNNGATAMGIATTGAVTIAAPSSGQALTGTGAADNYALEFLGVANTVAGQRLIHFKAGATAGKAGGLFVEAGTNSSDDCVYFRSQSASANFMQILGDGSGFLGYNGTNQVFNWTSAGVTTIKVSGTTIFSVNGTASPTIQGYGPTAAGLVDMTPDKGTFTITYADAGANNTTATASWTRNGNQVQLFFPVGTYTSSGTDFKATGLPAAIQPTRSFNIFGASTVGIFEDNSGTAFAGVSIGMNAGSGTVNFYRTTWGANNGWTNGNLKGVAVAFAVSYLLN